MTDPKTQSALYDVARWDEALYNTVAEQKTQANIITNEIVAAQTVLIDLAQQQVAQSFYEVTVFDNVENTASKLLNARIDTKVTLQSLQEATSNLEIDVFVDVEQKAVLDKFKVKTRLIEIAKNEQGLRLNAQAKVEIKKTSQTINTFRLGVISTEGVTQSQALRVLLTSDVFVKNFFVKRKRGSMLKNVDRAELSVKTRKDKEGLEVKIESVKTSNVKTKKEVGVRVKKEDKKTSSRKEQGL